MSVVFSEAKTVSDEKAGWHCFFACSPGAEQNLLLFIVHLEIHNTILYCAWDTFESK